MSLSQEELDQRVAILTRLRENLEKQRDKFKEYLRVLDVEEVSIKAGDIEKLEKQVMFEKSIVNEIYSFQKVIKPLEDMYTLAYPSRTSEISSLKDSLTSLQEEVLDRNARNRSLLKERMVEIRNKIQSVKVPPKRKSVYGGKNEASPHMIDIST
ncbi:flagellar export chaperone FlgN [Spirochaeta cellobiosiphila]|uniref:flagellar export chaperone FlgN n=1 Tax=Spirochaeta cellobiosiphila TaxID=504483 RepID=UPI000406561E|nr:flagellar export chaperone FlgN [Spirochaeta cellobiosiphila]